MDNITLIFYSNLLYY